MLSETVIHVKMCDDCWNSSVILRFLFTTLVNVAHPSKCILLFQLKHIFKCLTISPNSLACSENVLNFFFFGRHFLTAESHIGCGFVVHCCLLLLLFSFQISFPSQHRLQKYFPFRKCEHFQEIPVYLMKELFSPSHFEHVGIWLAFKTVTKQLLLFTSISVYPISRL